MIDTNNWVRFKMSDLGFVNYHGIRQTKSDRIDGDIPLLTAGKENQGVAAYISNAPSIYKDAITVDMFGNSFFHKGIYSGDDNIYFFVNKNISDNVKLFITAILNKENTKIYAFKEQFRQPNADALSVVLPTTSDGQPDWNYMESFMKKVVKESEIKLEKLTKYDYKKHTIDVSEWKEFKVGDLFEKLNLKCLKENFNKAIDCSEEQTDEFSLPLTNAKHFNNGIQFFGRQNEWESAEMTIDIVSNGAIATGDVYAQPQRTGVLWDSYLVKCKYDIRSEFVLQYLACVIQRCVKQYFGWNDKCTWEKVKEKKIKLPVKSTNEPNWDYMENFMKRIMLESEQTISVLTNNA